MSLVPFKFLIHSQLILTKQMIVGMVEDGLGDAKMTGVLEEIVVGVIDDDILYILYYNG